jgi:putative ABC transport system ATP-binding protein
MAAPRIDGLSISARRLRKHFDGGLVRAVDGVDLEIAAGERVAITGPTGCGKSTLLSLLALLERQDEGELELGGVPAPKIRDPDRWRAENLGIVFQFHHLLPHLSAEENVQLPLIGRGAPRDGVRRRSREMLAAVGLGHRAAFLATKLSGGERQLTAVARALIAGPALVLADEPTGSVDSRTGARILGLLLDGELTRRSTVVLVTHDPKVAARAGRTVTMLDGRMSPPAVPAASATDCGGACAAARV